MPRGGGPLSDLRPRGQCHRQLASIARCRAALSRFTCSHPVSSASVALLGPTRRKGLLRPRESRAGDPGAHRFTGVYPLRLRAWRSPEVSASGKPWWNV